MEDDPGLPVEAMGPKLAPIYRALSDDVIWLHAKWILYRQLFAEDTPGRLEKLNQAAGFYFYATQDVMWHDALMHIARLIDSPRSCGNDNLSLRAIPPLVKAALRKEIDALVDDAIHRCAFATEWRNKRIAHRDLEHALATAQDPLPGVSRAAIEDALLSIRDVMNRVQLRYTDGTTAYEHAILGPLDGDALARIVELGLASRAAEIARRQDLVRRLEAGEQVSPEELDFS